MPWVPGQNPFSLIPRTVPGPGSPLPPGLTGGTLPLNLIPSPRVGPNGLPVGTPGGGTPGGGTPGGGTPGGGSTPSGGSPGQLFPPIPFDSSGSPGGGSGSGVDPNLTRFMTFSPSGGVTRGPLPAALTGDVPAGMDPRLAQLNAVIGQLPSTVPTGGRYVSQPTPFASLPPWMLPLLFGEQFASGTLGGGETGTGNTGVGESPGIGGGIGP